MPDIDDRVISYWGSERLYRWRQDSVESAGISSETKQFLTNIGLPCHSNMIGLFMIDWDRDLSPETSRPGTRHLTKSGTFSLDESGGKVIRISSKGIPGGVARPESVYNTTIYLFAASLTEYHKYLSGVAPYIDINLGTRSVKEQCVKTIYNVDILESKLLEIDGLALSASNSGWKRRLDDIRADCE